MVETTPTPAKPVVYSFDVDEYRNKLDINGNGYVNANGYGNGNNFKFGNTGGVTGFTTTTTNSNLGGGFPTTSLNNGFSNTGGFTTSTTIVNGNKNNGFTQPTSFIGPAFDPTMNLGTVPGP